MTEKAKVFHHKLHSRALHIDYLRLRCGNEIEFSDHLDTKNDIRAHIAFSEWDVVLFIPSSELYPDNLINFYSDTMIAGNIAGSAGFFNYLWEHDINRGWEGRVLSREKTISMLVSLRFTDNFRRKLGLGAEILFCSFLEEVLKRDSDGNVSAVVAHSMGWNDATILLDATPGNEGRLLDVLTSIRYCTEHDLAKDLDSQAGAVAATYSHLLGNLKTYSAETLQFGSFCGKVKSARLLVRINPDIEKDLREKLGRLINRVIPDPKRRARIRSELGHYNFSANITMAFDSKPDKAVKIIQRVRKAIGRVLRANYHPNEASFPETTTEITYKEILKGRSDHGSDRSVTTPSDGDSPASTLSGQYKALLERLLAKEPRELKRWPMTANRLAILLGTIITFLDDPVRSSVVGHLCRFLDKMFIEVLQRSDRAGHEDLCHILEYALHQAADGLTQFQHDANSLGISGRGGYNRLIQAVEEFIDQAIAPFQLGLVPLITFGLRPSNDGTTLKYWVDLPFSTAFVPERWYVTYYDVARMCWHRSYEWRLDSHLVWKQYSTDVVALETHARDDDRQEFVLGRDVVDELFPNYFVLNVVCAGDTSMLDRLMVAKEFLTRPQPALIQNLTLRLVLDVLLKMHEMQHRGEIGSRNKERKKHGLPSETREVAKFQNAHSREEVHKLCDTVAFEWWEDWWKIDEWLTANGATDERESREAKKVREEKIGGVDQLIEQAATSLREVIGGIEHPFKETDAAQAFECTKVLISRDVFKADALQIVKRVIRLLALRGRDYAQRQPVAFAVFDPSAVEFGFILGKIKVMRCAAEEAASKVQRYRKEIEDGCVFAFGTQPPPLAHILTASGETLRSVDDPSHASMLSCLSSVLSLWHSAVTRDAGETREHPEEPLRLLEQMGVVESAPF